MYYTYSRHKTRDAAEDALDDYYCLGVTTPGERPRVRYERGLWLVEFFDGSYCD
jgi:hypothetical protein